MTIKNKIAAVGIAVMTTMGVGVALAPSASAVVRGERSIGVVASSGNGVEARLGSDLNGEGVQTTVWVSPGGVAGRGTTIHSLKNIRSYKTSAGWCSRWQWAAYDVEQNRHFTTGWTLVLGGNAGGQWTAPNPPAAAANNASDGRHLRVEHWNC